MKEELGLSLKSVKGQDGVSFALSEEKLQANLATTAWPSLATTAFGLSSSMQQTRSSAQATGPNGRPQHWTHTHTPTSMRITCPPISSVFLAAVRIKTKVTTVTRKTSRQVSQKSSENQSVLSLPPGLPHLATLPLRLRHGVWVASDQLTLLQVANDPLVFRVIVSSSSRLTSKPQIPASHRSPNKV